MKNRVVLVTGAGGDIGQSVIKCIKHETNDKVVACDIDCYAAGKAYADEFYVAPRVSNKESYLEFIKFIINEKGITHIIPITEYEIKIFSDNKIRQLFKDIKIMINDSYIVDTFLDKFKTIEFFVNNNIAYPKTINIGEYNQEFGYPLIIKEKSSRGGKGVYVVNSLNEFKYYTENIKDSIVQQLIGSEDEEYTMAIFSDGINTSNIAFRRYLGYGSLSKFVELVSDEKLNDIAIKIATILKLKGSINIQMRKEKNEFIPFEINPRISSTVAFRNHFGFKDVIWWLDILDNNEVDIKYKAKYSKGIGIRVVDEVYFDMEEL